MARFLISRRTRLLPESCGLPQFRRRRRAPGLRREEVSALAGISTAYYTWIEQGRRFDVSTQVLDGIAGALQLNEIEAAHLFTLAGKSTQRPPLALDSVASWRGAVFQFVRFFEHGPALVLTPWLDVNEANLAARETLGVGAGANFAEAFFCGEGAVTYRSSDALAGTLVALLRRNHARDIDNARFNDVIATLRERSSAFKALWDGHAVDNAPLFEVEIERAGAGKSHFHGVIVSDPIGARQFALFMRRSKLEQKGGGYAMPVPRNHEPGESRFKAILPEQIAWHPFDAFPARVRLAILVGHPAEPGPYVIRVKVPRGVKLPPHKHPEDRIYTVMSGVFYIGRGDKFEGDAVTGYPPGSVIVLPGNTSHFHWAKSGEYVTQVAAAGPLGLEYVDPSDDPRNAATDTNASSV